MSSTQPRPKVLHTISGNIHFYEPSDDSRQARRAHSIHASSVSRNLQVRRTLNAHSSFDYLIPSTRPNENTKDTEKKDTPKPVFLERCLAKNGSAALESCPAFDFLQPVKWNKIPKDKSSPEYHGWERIPGMLSNTEFDSEKWKHYIKRDRKGRDKHKNFVIWTNENENAFQIAVRIVPVVGKKKFNQTKTGDDSVATGKGRNEVIGQVIERLTGVRLARKQISSHIQVLTGFMDHSSEWLKAVKRDQLREQARRAAIRLYNEADDQICLIPSKDTDGNIIRRELGSLRPMISSISGRRPSTSSRPVRPSVKRLEFDTRVWLEKPPSSGDWREIYSFTSMQSEHGAAPIALENLGDWQNLYPDLAKVHQTCGKIDGEVVDIQATFKLEEMPAKSHLGIQVFVDVAHTAGYSKWRYSSRFYSSTGKAVYHCSNDIKPCSIRESSKVRLEIPLESKWWVNVFWRFSRQRNAAIAQGTQEALQQEERRTRHELQGISISQEIFATDAFGCERRLMTLLWRFDQTVGNEVATTVWRKVIQHHTRHAPSSPKLEDYEDVHVNNSLLMEIIPADNSTEDLLFPSIEDAQVRQGQALEWLTQPCEDMERYRGAVGDDLFNLSQTHQVAHSQESRYDDNPIDPTKALVSQSFESTAWEPVSRDYAGTYEEPPCDYQDSLAMNDNTSNRPGTKHTVGENPLYISHPTDPQLENFSGGEIRLQYGLSEEQLEQHVDHSSQGHELRDLGLEHSHEDLHAILGFQQQPHELVLDPAFSDPNHAINNIYHYPTLESNFDDNKPDLKHQSLPSEIPDYHSPNHHDEYQPPAVEHSQILPSQPELHDTHSESSISHSQSARPELTTSSHHNELILSSQQDDTGQTQVIDSLTFEDDWDPHLVPHLFDGPDFHATALEILGTEIALPDTHDYQAIGFHAPEARDPRDDEHARVLGEVGVDVGVDEAKDWVLVKGLDGLDGQP